VPRISEFYGIVIWMYWEAGAQHYAAHFRARHGEHHAAIGIDPLALLAGSLPPKSLGRAVEWAALHQEELLSNWQRVLAGEALEPIAPLP